MYLLLDILKCDYKTLKKSQIARENPEIEREMLVAVEEVLNTGQAMSAAAREFANDPCSSVKRGNMVGHRKLLKFLFKKNIKVFCLSLKNKNLYT
jgi:hypothetical protein